ncbi:hypothetical protein [Haloarchaeobius litoreus]|uniref:Uncharacterized protein n=1 Tax=Haloarchaeobius litoreus TaxID=755306 RepID=A0ABD6DMG0_9EURY|nr:hypothetical protein [Haloarchaeobius litoreus]
MESDGRVDVLRYPDSVDEPRVRAVTAGEGRSVVHEAAAEYRRKRRKDRFPLWISFPLVAGAMTIGPTGQLDLPLWTPVAAAFAALSLLWWLFTAVDARRGDPVPELVATDCTVAVARNRFGATVVEEPVPPDDGGAAEPTWTGETAAADDTPAVGDATAVEERET